MMVVAICAIDNRFCVACDHTGLKGRGRTFGLAFAGFGRAGRRVIEVKYGCRDASHASEQSYQPRGEFSALRGIDRDQQSLNLWEKRSGLEFFPFEARLLLTTHG